MRENIRNHQLCSENPHIESMLGRASFSAELLSQVENNAQQLISNIRELRQFGLMEVFLAEYGLSTEEGVALMCLAEAFLRVPDDQTRDTLISDKIAASAWGSHLGQSHSALVNASTWGLVLTKLVLQKNHQDAISKPFKKALARLGEPVIRSAVKQAMKILAGQFVLGQTIGAAQKNAVSCEKNGFTYSYDMLGEAALTESDAINFFNTYQSAISSLALNCTAKDCRDNPGISIKLSALHPRYELAQKSRVMIELVGRVSVLANLAMQANMGFNIDAEESERLDLSLDIIEAVLRDPKLANWNGFGVVVQAYSKQAPAVLDWVYQLAQQYDRKLMVRLVKGAYWDREIKRSQVEGLANFVVYSKKSATDVAYMCCAKQLLKMSDRIYPQFATHNAHTAAAILALATDKNQFEFQRLHGMGEALHKLVKQQHKTRCRIYAPVGPHRDLLAYLVRRLLENGANSSFVNQLINPEFAASLVAADPVTKWQKEKNTPALGITKPQNLFIPDRRNSKGWDLDNLADRKKIDQARAAFADVQWQAGPTLASTHKAPQVCRIINPAQANDTVGYVTLADESDVTKAVRFAQPWTACNAAKRAEVLIKASALFEQNYGELIAVLIREAGKTPKDAIAELREAVDFLRYYASQSAGLADNKPCGLIACISPWNFPLAIFTGQIAAALAAGNGVLAKPAEPTPITANIAVRLLHEAGVPKSALLLLPGDGSLVGAKLTSNPSINGVCFTGSTQTAHLVHQTMAEHLRPQAPLIAETGGLNAMIVDSTALPEQAIKDIIVSAFQSAGQRCSALRMLYLQDDIAEQFQTMLFAAMDELVIGKPWDYATDLGPVISAVAANDIDQYIKQAKSQGRLLKQISTAEGGHYIAPSVIAIDGIEVMEKEIFGPVLHIATFAADKVNTVVDAINNSGYGLTVGLHSRINERIKSVTAQLNVGNIYINRNQIGAIVGSQPFGGEGLSGTGPKAGGPRYVKRLTRNSETKTQAAPAEPANFNDVQSAIDKLCPAHGKAIASEVMPGPTGEANVLLTYPRGTILCLGPTLADLHQQMSQAAAMGCQVIGVAPGASESATVSGFLKRSDLAHIRGIDGLVLWSDDDDLTQARLAIAKREGAIIPLITAQDIRDYCIKERHVCTDTTAAGGNASLLSAAV